MIADRSVVRSFDLPEESAATEPPEARGLARDGVRLLVAHPDGLHHVTFRDILRFFRTGDLVVFNTSATLPAAIDGVRDGHRSVVIHFSARLDDDTWTVELREPDGLGQLRDGVAGERIRLAGGGELEVVAAHTGPEGRSRLLRAAANGFRVGPYLERFGRPITYPYLRGRYPLAMYQTIFARDPGSAEMPSAGRPFTSELVTQMASRGIGLAPILLHAGVSSLERGEGPLPERFRVSPETARLVNATRAAGGSIIAVGTTVTRALETVADEHGDVSPGEGWTELVLTPERPARVVDGLVTGWHAPDASHQLLLEAVVGGTLVDRAYAAAVGNGYLWHEFGDSCLLIPRRDSPAL